VSDPLALAAPARHESVMSNRIPLTGPVVWRGDDIKNSKRWIRDLPKSAFDDLDAALAAVKSKGLDWSQITRQDFPLASLDSLLADIAGELENGVGIMKLRGFPVDRYDEDDLRKVYFGLGTHLGTPVFQNRSGELMRAIRDEGAHAGRTYGETKDQTGATFLSSYARTLTNGSLRFHTDRTDVVGLLCVRQARAGGVGDRDQGGTAEGGERPQAGFPGTEHLGPEPRDHVVEGRVALHPGDAVEHVAKRQLGQQRGGGLVVPVALEVQRGEAQRGREQGERDHREQRPPRCQPRPPAAAGVDRDRRAAHGSRSYAGSVKNSGKPSPSAASSKIARAPS